MPTEQTSNPALEYLHDAWQRSILFLDVLRQRGDQYRERAEQVAPHVLVARSRMTDPRSAAELTRNVSVRWILGCLLNKRVLQL